MRAALGLHLWLSHSCKSQLAANEVEFIIKLLIKKFSGGFGLVESAPKMQSRLFKTNQSKFEA
jgi:hypothetical protein